MIFFSLEASASNLVKYSILMSFLIWVSSYKFKFFVSFANKSLSGRELNSSSGVFFVVSTHFLIKIFRFFIN